jgi:hypothetical protein
MTFETDSKLPKDIDVVAFLYRPDGMDALATSNVMHSNIGLFDRHAVKTSFRVDFFFIGLEESIEGVVKAARYYAALFSHRRSDFLWKGMLEVRLENVADDAAALAILGPLASPPAVGTVP